MTKLLFRFHSTASVISSLGWKFTFSLLNKGKTEIISFRQQNLLGGIYSATGALNSHCQPFARSLGVVVDPCYSTRGPQAALTTRLCGRSWSYRQKSDCFMFGGDALLLSVNKSFPIILLKRAIILMAIISRGELLALLPLTAPTNRQEICLTLMSFFLIVLGELVSVSTDGAPSTVGRERGLISLHFYIIDQEQLCCTLQQCFERWTQNNEG